MSSYFDRIEQTLMEAVERRARLPWYRRALSTGRGRGLAVVLAALVVAAPAVGAITNWYGIGAPDNFGKQSPTIYQGRALPKTSQLLPLRVADPQGGPPWGLRLVRTTRDDTCIQLGRVQDGQLGSLGIDGAWHDDHLFHAFPNTSEGTDCGTTDAVGDGFVNVVYTGRVANADPERGADGAQDASCRPRTYPLRPLSADGRLPARIRDALRREQEREMRDLCPPGAVRIVFMGLLGPDATSITYEAPNHTLKTEKTSGADGAYLLVFTMNRSSCDLYTHSRYLSYGPCGSSESVGGASPTLPGAVRSVSYRNGHVCQLDSKSSQQQRALVENWEKHYITAHHIHVLTTAERSAFRHATLVFMAEHHISPATLRSQVSGGSCPAVGYVATKEKRVTSAMVATPIHVKVLLHTSTGPEVFFRFIARRAVTSSASWYEFSLSPPEGCGGESAGQIDLGNVRAGKPLHTSNSVSICKGVYHLIVGYMENSGPINQEDSGGGTPGQDGSVIVGRSSFTIS